MRLTEGFKGKIAICTLAALCLITVMSGFMGVDYGIHWDEYYISMGIANSIENLTFIPNTYTYSGMYFNMGYLALAPELIDFWNISAREIRRLPHFEFDLDEHPAIIEAQRDLEGKVNSKDFKLRLRKMYVIISSLSVLVLYLAVRGWRGGYLEPLLGAGLMALSWEVNYHSRYIAVDNMMMVFGSIVLLCVIRHSRQDESASDVRWLLVGSVAAGMAAGSKISGLPLVIPLMLSPLVFRRGMSASSVMIRVIMVPVCALAALFIVSPGIFLDPVRFYNSFVVVSADYGTRYGTGYSYYAEPYLGQIPLIAGYLVQSAFSPYGVVSLVFSVFALVGIWSVYRENWKLLIVMVSFPVVYLSVFAGMKLMIVRNFLVLFPFMAVAVSRGIGETYVCLSGIRFSRLVLGAFLACWVVLNTTWMFDAAASVRQYNLKESVAELAGYMKDNPRRVYYLSPGVINIMVSSGLSEYANMSDVNEGRTGEPLCALFYAELLDEVWQANRSGFFEYVTGSHEINFDYYPTWIGHNYDTRIYLLTLENARKIGYGCRAPWR